MSTPGPLLVVALSGRALAVAARRSGRLAAVIDRFADTDTRAAASALAAVRGDAAGEGFDPDALLAAAERLAPPSARPALVYGAGLEDRPELIARLAVGRELCGNAPEVVAAAKDPEGLAALLARLELPHPPVTRARPRDPRGWLAKRVGAAGGAHVRPASACVDGVDAGDPARAYFQRRVPGLPLSATFLADGRRACLVGVAEQWAAPAAGARFRFGGVLGPAAVHPALAAALPPALDALAAALGLRGLNTLDLVAEGPRWHAIELNPRPGASLELFDHPGAPSLLAAHLAACAGRLPDGPPPPPPPAALAVVYAPRPARLEPGLDLPAWAADRPAPGARFDAGAPVCTVRAEGASTGAARAGVARRAAHVRSRLEAIA